jgi:membrane associated rhomboid family serine protease
LPLSDRDYMRPSQPDRGFRQSRSPLHFSLSPLALIILANFILYIAKLVAGNDMYPMGNYFVITDKFTYYLGLIPYYFSDRPWTILTNMFIHADFWHLFVNMLTLFFFARALSGFIGQNKLLLVYFIGGIVGNGLYLLLGDSLSVAIGASGAVYAVAGALVVLAPNIRVMLYFIVPMPLWVVVLVFFVIWSFVPGVAWQAHIGGLAVGLVAGFIFKRRRRYYVF